MDAFDLIIIGAGPGGYVAAIRAAQLGLKTACIDKRKELGGTCLHVGCIPSKSLLSSSELLWNIKEISAANGIIIAQPSINFTKMMTRKTQIIQSFSQGITSLFKKHKISSYVGEASFLSSTEVLVKNASQATQLQARFILIATGSKPIELPFLPFDEKQILSSTGALSLKEIPKDLLIIGAGVIGVELGSVYNRLGTKVQIIEFLDQICTGFDHQLILELKKDLEKQGINFYLSSKVMGAKIASNQISLQVEQKSFSAEKVLVAIGRRPYTQGLGLEKIGVKISPKGFIETDGIFRSNIPNIFAIGDVVEGPMLAHKASEEGIAAVEIMAGHRPQLNYMAIPNVVYTHPEMASVGLTEEEAKKYHLIPKIGSFPFKANSRAKCTGETQGFVKIVTEEKSKRIIGVHIIGTHASELIAEAAIAIQKSLCIKDLINTPYAHPTLSEAIREAALDVEKRALHK
ncbi:Dihydrolipoyl dehydrogenase [Candidatus Rhabdochlamydia oedothoracis]|uniref:Dihydrolipoyl dehydrogenase n=1 Tax=Candidatus Rhabdochlamydia oedothoracis TaxID=2720720 RepID=A0ABX8V6U0_9BACT|nr:MULTISPECIES: dihydrolipoyl dehydrogenase [Rhabdochlamydia]KAG6558903.1 Dihydrolipoyl dehydrogenase [Candidatus Rhabdochlamydia sp. W815]MCL6755663.1 dihydrolipoyl dehydrogenase [Candidatus Rhabdochlamydia oedothoracis]QYF48728.1 Dihydrolipoyl dehydrogenase [Candidatus Rhabdochlamydia oedothoracis]